MTVSVGGEIGEVGKKNSTEDELRAYLAGYERELAERAPGAPGISKVSVQTGTSHGGVPLPDGSVAEVKLDFDVLARLGEVAREHGLAGAVQHGASTLPGRALPPLPGRRDRRDPPRDRLPERALRAPGVPAGAPSRDRGLVLRERDRRAEARPDRPAVRLHDPQEGDRAVQARAVGPRDEGRDPRGPAAQDRVPLHGARRERLAGDGRPRTSGRFPSTCRCRTPCARHRPGPAADDSGRRHPAGGPSDPARDAGRPRGDRPAPARGVRRPADPAADRGDPGVGELHPGAGPGRGGRRRRPGERRRRAHHGQLARPPDRRRRARRDPRPVAARRRSRVAEPRDRHGVDRGPPWRPPICATSR